MPSIAPPVVANIPSLLKTLNRWVVWRAGQPKLSGKFDKIPVDPQSGLAVNALEPKYWLSFEKAIEATRKGAASGIGIVLADTHPIDVAGQQLYLAAIDLDNCARRMDECQQLWHDLERPYVEVSPSGSGLHFFGLSATALKGGNAGEGREMYSGGRFMTVTGVMGRGAIKEISGPLVALERRWWPNRAAIASVAITATPPTRPETLANIAEVIDMLKCVSSDMPYEPWRDIIWAIASTGWRSAPRLAHHWSALASHRYDSTVVDKLLASFDCTAGITVGTLVHHARLNGWSGRMNAVNSVQAQAQPTVPPPPPAIPSRLLTAAQVKALPSTPYRIRGLFPAKGLAAIYGEPSSGKTFLALDLAHAVASGRAAWFGLAVNQSPVAYVALEGEGGLKKRLIALELHTGILCVDALRFWCSNFAILTDVEVDALADEILRTLGKGGVVFIDTLNQAAPGADENASQDMGRIIAGAKRLSAKVNGLVVLVHHAGKNRSLGLRGHSSLLAAMDAVVEVVRMPQGRLWRATKVKDDSGDLARDFVLKTYHLGQDAFGPVSSCAVEQTAHIGAPVKGRITGRHQRVAIATLTPALSGAQVIDYKDAIATVASALTTTKGKERDRAREAIDALIRAGLLSMNDNGLFLVA